MAAVVDQANAMRRTELRATARAAALSRRLSGITRAMREGLDPILVRRLIGGVGGDDAIAAQVCFRPEDQIELDEALLDPDLRQIGVDTAAVTVTWTTDRQGTSVPRLRWPRVCLYLLQ